MTEVRIEVEDGNERRVLGAGFGEMLTLSVSIVATSSSASTASPGFLSHDLSVPSEMDSAI